MQTSFFTNISERVQRIDKTFPNQWYSEAITLEEFKELKSLGFTFELDEYQREYYGDNYVHYEISRDGKTQDCYIKTSEKRY